MNKTSPRAIRLIAAAAAGPLLALASLPGQAANVFQTDLQSITATGTAGVLRPGSGWEGSQGALAALSTVVDGNFLPDNQQWTLGTYWWDAFALPQTVNTVRIEITLNSAHTINQFILQGDNNEQYLIEYWDGLAWQEAYTAPQFFTDGLETRDSGTLSAVTSDRFRVTAVGGDAYYSLSEIQAFAADNPVPAPGSLALSALGIALLLRRRQRA